MNRSHHSSAIKHQMCLLELDVVRPVLIHLPYRWCVCVSMLGHTGMVESSMKSCVITVRLTPPEVAMLDRIRLSTNNNKNRSECVRLLIHREYARRKRGTSVVPDRDIASDWRNGRPRGKRNTLSTVKHSAERECRDARPQVAQPTRS